MKKRDVSIVIPAYNEEEGIGTMIKELRAYDNSWEIIVVDDGSSDKTREIAQKKQAVVLQHPYNIGYGAALKTGIRAAKHNAIVIMDADRQHRDFEDIDRLLEHIDTYDMVVGARSFESYQPFFRRIGKWFFTKLANYLIQKKIPDLNSGFRAFRKELVVNHLPLLPNRFSFTTTLTLLTFSEGKTVKYVPIKTYKRVGKSTVKLFKDGFETILSMLRIIMLFNPLRVFLPFSIILFILGITRLFTGIIVGIDYTITSILGILSGLLIFFFGLLADQIASLRRDASHSWKHKVD